LVVFCADAPEFRSVDETMRLYKAMLKRATELKSMKPERIELVWGRRLEFGAETHLLMFRRRLIFVVANPTGKMQHAHLWDRLSVPPRSVGVLKTDAHGEAEAALFIGDFWGIGLEYRTELLARAEGLTVLVGEPPSFWISRPPMSFIPLQHGEIQIRCTTPKVKVTVCDLLTGKVLLSQRMEAKDGWLKFKVPPELVLTQWRIASGE